VQLEQASKVEMRTPTRRFTGEGLSEGGRHRHMHPFGSPG